ncbi:MAG TPA: 50S ribosomal protein L19 [Candidatus Acidoferrum sp.]|nr:50S ribosomal protein L19 [Candidatus Acidoferrum sp.]
MYQLIQKVESKYRKQNVVDVRTGDTVRVYQKVKEGSKERIQMFEGVVIRTDRKASLTSSITVRRIASGVGVEKTYLLHSPLVLKVEVTKRSKVRRKFLSFLRERSGKSARLVAVDFDKKAVNTVADKHAEAELEHMKEEAAEQHEAQVSEAEAAEKNAETEA